MFFVATTRGQALEMAKIKLKNPNLLMSDLSQDEDVLDTWFSSWLWPISVFDGFNNKTELNYYYPTQVLVTGWDIIFLWVARMIIAGYEWESLKPFKEVYFTGMVRDKKRRKMSKSLGNSPDALQLIDSYGADGVRFGMLACSPAGGDLLFDEKLPEQGRNFCNKMWNALNLIKGWEISDDVSADQSEMDVLAIEWFENRTHQVSEKLKRNFEAFKLSEALMELYNYIWSDFCSWYLELIKPHYGSNQITTETLKQTIKFYERICTLLHPFMPFVTEEIWHRLVDRTSGEDCMMSSYPPQEHYDEDPIPAI